MTPYWPFPSRAWRLLLLPLLAAVVHGAFGTLYTWRFISKFGSNSASGEVLLMSLREWWSLAAASAVGVFLAQALVDSQPRQTPWWQRTFTLVVGGLILVQFLGSILWYWLNPIAKWSSIFQLSPTLLEFPVLLAANIAPSLHDRWLDRKRP